MPVTLASTSDAFLGDDLLPWLLLALGAAMVVGNAAALLRPPPEGSEAPPLWRAMAMIAVGAIAAIWAFASLLSG